MSGLIDLHTHSTASDGSLSPRELVQYAKNKGAAAIALTDHDTLEGLDEALAAGREMDLEVIPGVEISAQHNGGTMHLLGYYMNPRDKGLKKELQILQEARKDRNPKIIEKLRQMGLPIQFDQVTALAKGQIGRPHIAQSLLRSGVVSSLEEAFQKYLTKGAPAYIEKFRFSPQKSIHLILEAGGIPILAHPKTLKSPSIRELMKLVKDLKAAGLKGLEVFYPDHSPDQTRTYMAMAQELDLLCTGGSDFHGNNKERVDLLVGFGDLKVPYKIIEDLKAIKNNNKKV
jgi:predicted metal-dependent phosphoesterase TrpH